MAVYTSSSRYQLINNGRYAEPRDTDAVAYTQYVVREGESFESLAARLYNDGKRYWEIARINPQVEFPDFIPVGTVIRLPR